MRVGAGKTSIDRRDLELISPGLATAATLAHERTLAVSAGLAELVPSGALVQGSTLAVHGPGATSLALAVSAEAVRAGSFLAIVSSPPPSFGLGACLDFDIPLRRVVQFVLPDPAGPTDRAQLLAAIVEGFDLVILADRFRIGGTQARRLVARIRERGSVVIRTGGPAWPDGADLRFDLQTPDWSGLGPGHGHLGSRTLTVQVAGRRWHGMTRARTLRFDVEAGRVTANLESAASADTPRPRGVAGAQRDDPRHAGSDIDRLVPPADDRPESGTGAGSDAVASDAVA